MLLWLVRGRKAGPDRDRFSDIAILHSSLRSKEGRSCKYVGVGHVLGKGGMVLAESQCLCSMDGVPLSLSLPLESLLTTELH